VIKLTSGGIDSVIAHRLMPGRSIYYRLGTVSEGKELRALEWANLQEWSPKIMVSDDLLSLGQHEFHNGYLPYRNGLLVTFAAMIDPLVMVSQVAEWAPDKNRRYWRGLERTLTQAGSTQEFSRNVKIATPFAHLTKGELLRRYKGTFGWDQTALLLENTWSCYGSQETHCGRCAGCQQRQVAEWVAGCEQTVYRMPKLDLPKRKDMAKDGLRWVRDNRSIVGLAKRTSEVYRFERACARG
jgi:7-cyano-7-deazaguanine synthase in queuosine biosynthesis